MSDSAEGLIYYGNSMRGIFSSGDRIFCKAAALEDLSVGDIVVVNPGNSSYIHRVIKLDRDFAVTMGDNNDFPDKLRLNNSSEFFQLESAIRRGKVLKIAQGQAGMRHFMCIQRRRNYVRKFKKTFRQLEKHCFWRITLRDAETFADGSRCFFWHGIAIARVSKSGVVKYKSLLKRLFFYVKKGQ